MNYKVYLYIICFMLSLYSISSIDFKRILKPDKDIESKLLILFLSLSIGYLVTNFIEEFLALTKLF